MTIFGRRSGILGAAGLLFLSVAVSAQQNSAIAAGTLAASVVSGVSLQKSNDLVLGEFRPGASSGTVEVDVDGSGLAASRVSSGGVSLAGASFSAAEFSVLARAGARFSVQLPPAITLGRIGGSESMQLDGFRSQIHQNCDSGTTPSGCPGSPYTLLVGATLHVEPGQKAGHYVGTFMVTVNQL
jgi:hypothetical protein